MSDQRVEVMATLYRVGYTLQQIGVQYGLTRERVRQILKKHGLRRSDGGQAVTAARTEQRRLARMNEMSLRKWGCPFEEYVRIREMKKPTRAYAQQRSHARARGIGWELNLWQWWSIWQQSDHWAERGRGQGYVMCRFGDIGPYAPGNVFIALASQNISEGSRKRLDLPIGVTETKSGKYAASRIINRRSLYLGIHPTPELAHAAYLMAGAA